jgi:RimJ/RimL family protein N-acetyltransferase
MPIEIMQIREEHIEGYNAVLGAVARERRYLAFVDAPPMAMTRDFVQRNISKGYPQFVPVEDGRVIGWCDVTPLSRETMRHGGVLGMGLSPDRRGRGIGRELIGRTLDAARAFGLVRVELTVRHDNVAALALYRKLGFGVEGCNRRAMRVDGVFHDLIMMALLFDVDAQVSDPGGQIPTSGG